MVCCSDEAMLAANLMASPCLGPGSPHEVIALRNPPMPRTALNPGRSGPSTSWSSACTRMSSCPPGWDRQIVEQYRLAERRFGPIGVAGVYGVGAGDRPGHPGSARGRRIGRVVDRDRVLRDGPELPAPVATLDELLLIVPRDSPLRFDPELGFHLYGADLCLQARERGLAVVALEAPCRHNSRNRRLARVVLRSARVFARKWASRLPVATPCVLFDREGQVFVLGNAEAGRSRSPGAGRVGPALSAMGGSWQSLGEVEGRTRIGGFSRRARLVPAIPRIRADRAGSRTSGDSAQTGLASIIVPCWNQREFTQLCVQAPVPAHPAGLGADRHR